MNIESVFKWMRNALKNLSHGHIMVVINVTDGKIVFVRKRKEETEKDIDDEDAKEYNIDN